VRRRLDLVAYWRARSDLDEAAKHAHVALRLSQPGLLAARVAVTIAQLERDCNRFDVSLALLCTAIDRLSAMDASRERDRVLVAALAGAGDIHRRTARYRASGRYLDSARTLAETLGEPGPLTTVCTLLGIVAKELGRYEEAERHYARVGALLSAAGAGSADAASNAHNLAGLAHARGRYVEAERHARRAASLRVRQPVETAEDLAVLAAALAGQERYDEAARLLEQVMRVCREAKPLRWYEVAVQLHSLAAIDHAAGRLAVAEARYREAFALKEKLLGPDHPELALVLHNLAILLRAQGRDDEAATHLARATRIAERVYPGGHPLIAALYAAATR
jgi:tetratricopeptide (TPR) repeat protein